MSKLKLTKYERITRKKSVKTTLYCFALVNKEGEKSEIREYTNSWNRERGINRFQAARVKAGKKPYILAK